MNEEEIKYIEETDIYSLGHEDKFDEIIKFDKAIKNLIKENTELKEELDYYKQKESQEFDERDYYEE